MQRNEIKIVSGGQTGVDRGALQAAMDLVLDWGGWAPKGWRAENGTIPPLYREKMLEHASANYLGRTRRNVVDSHATLIVTNTYPLSGGTLKTRLFCQEAMRSHFIVSLGESDAVGKTRRWLAQFFAIEHPVPFVLNVAGPRESKAGGIQKRTRKFVTEVLHGMLDGGGVRGAPALPVRKALDHRGPLSIDVSGAWYFITICAEGHAQWRMSNPSGRAGAPRTPNPPTFDSIANVLLQHAREYQMMGKWRLALFLVMPDHLHFIVHAPCVHGDENDGGVRGAPALPRLIADWKHWLVANYGIAFQANFWDTRLRDEAHFAEKFQYIRKNPVRKGLCASEEEWPYVVTFS